MYIFLIFISLFSIVHINGLRIVSFFDETDYNPCATKSDVYFYPHPTDLHKYYQCDESRNAYLRSCGDLMWDQLRVSCNWPSNVAPPTSESSSTPEPWSTTTWPTATLSQSPARLSWLTTTSTRPLRTVSWTTTTSARPLPTFSWTTTTSARPLPTFSWTTTTPSWFSSTSSSSTRTSSTSSSTTTEESSSTTDFSPLSLCKPIDPCGGRGKCIESFPQVPNSARRFACICSDKWFGRLCEKPITELTTPSPPLSDENMDTFETTESFSLPIKTEKDSKLLFYGLKASSTIPAYNQTIEKIDSQK